MTRQTKRGELEITSYSYEGSNKYISEFSAKLEYAIKIGIEAFEWGKYVYEITYLRGDEGGHAYEVSKYLKADCKELVPGIWIIDSPTRMMCGTIVANVWRSE